MQCRFSASIAGIPRASILCVAQLYFRCPEDLPEDEQSQQGPKKFQAFRIFVYLFQQFTALGSGLLVEDNHRATVSLLGDQTCYEWGCIAKIIMIWATPFSRALM
jgi:hypothetical protein